jgi:hypothetical protein
LPTPADVEPISNFHSDNIVCSSTSVVDQNLLMDNRQAKIARGKRLLHDYRASKTLQAPTQVHEAGWTSISPLLGVDVPSTVISSIGPSFGIGAAHPLCIHLGEPPATAGKSAADNLAGSAYAGVDPFSASGINAALPPRTGIGVPPPLAGLSTAKSMADSASAGVFPFFATDAAYDYAADTPDNPLESTADCYFYSASRG